MTGKVISLRSARKRKARDQKSAEAAENRARFGRSKLDREIEESEADRARRLWQGHRVETGEDDQDG